MIPDTTTIKACCDCKFEMRLMLDHGGFGSEEVRPQVWASNICDLHKKEMKENFMNAIGGLLQ